MNDYGGIVRDSPIKGKLLQLDTRVLDDPDELLESIFARATRLNTDSSRSVGHPDLFQRSIAQLLKSAEEGPHA